MMTKLIASYYNNEIAEDLTDNIDMQITYGNWETNCSTTWISLF